VITALPGVGDRGHLGGVSPVAVDLAVVVGYDRDGLAADDQPEPVLGHDGNGLACVDHADLDYRLRP